MQYDFVRRCKRLLDDELFKTRHLSDRTHTLCGKEINHMWMIENSDELSITDVTCKKCLEVYRDEI